MTCGYGPRLPLHTFKSATQGYGIEKRGLLLHRLGGSYSANAKGVLVGLGGDGWCAVVTDEPLPVLPLHVQHAETNRLSGVGEARPLATRDH